VAFKYKLQDGNNLKFHVCHTLCMKVNVACMATLLHHITIIVDIFHTQIVSVRRRYSPIWVQLVSCS